MKRWLLMIIMFALLLSGCSGIRVGHYHSVEAHDAQSNQMESQNISVTNYDQLCQALVSLTNEGIKSQVISFAEYDQTKLDQDMRKAIWWVKTYDPITAYAVEKITFEKGTSSGQSAVAVSISYIHDRTEIRKIQKAKSIKNVRQLIQTALNNSQAGVVLLWEEYKQTDFEQLVEDYAVEFPQLVMETPKVSATVYPETGEQRVVELKFTYQNSRETLRQMQSQVSSVFSSAELYVFGKGPTMEKAALLYAFLVERYDYQLETSITPAYSLLQYGVGDNKAFASVYAAMCEQSGLRCQVITGTRRGEPWFWNLIDVGGVYYHVDLLRCNELGGFRTWMDADMDGYVWDYFAYPESVLPESENPETGTVQPIQDETDPS